MEVIEAVIVEDNLEEIHLEINDAPGGALISKKEGNRLEMEEDGLFVGNMDVTWSNSEW